LNACRKLARCVVAGQTSRKAIKIRGAYFFVLFREEEGDAAK